MEEQPFDRELSRELDAYQIRKEAYEERLAQWRKTARRLAVLKASKGAALPPAERPVAA